MDEGVADHQQAGIFHVESHFPGTGSRQFNDAQGVKKQISLCNRSEIPLDSSPGMGGPGNPQPGRQFRGMPLVVAVGEHERHRRKFRRHFLK